MPKQCSIVIKNHVQLIGYRGFIVDEGVKILGEIKENVEILGEMRDTQYESVLILKDIKKLLERKA